MESSTDYKLKNKWLKDYEWMLELGEFSNSFLRVEVSSASESSESKHSFL